ncbi:GTP binding protein Rhes [Trichuris trichiura]|uniref:GTP binding protein Rhes n=1 Tax=Trichuris trichiura TaxID=36087 RepID=A0A077ZD71_TRITR|nr:GTP binding protein Rhes [Trichuris trichiura]
MIATQCEQPREALLPARRRLNSGARRDRGSLPIIKVNVVILGASQVGKTAIASQFLWNKFYAERYKPTVEDFNWIEYTMNGGEETLLFELIDSAGSRDFLAMRKLYMSTGDAFVIVHAVDDRASFEEAKELREQVRCLNTKDAPVILVTNKMDLLHDGVIQRRAVSQEEVIEYANSHNCRWIEVTAKEFSSVENIFQTLFAQKLLSYQEYKSLKKRRQSMPLPQPPPSRASGKTGRSASASEVSQSKSSSSCILS